MMNTNSIKMFVVSRWPQKSDASDEKNDRVSEHLIMSEMGPGQTDRYVSRLEGELEEYMMETVTESIEADGEVTSQTIRETQKFFICGVVDPRTGGKVTDFAASVAGLILTA